MSSSTAAVYRTESVPAARDWYYHLRQRISTVRALIMPLKPDDPDQRPSFETCTKGRLFQYISFVHTSIVSHFCFPFFLPISFIFIQKEHADRDPDFLSDPLVVRFLNTLSPMVLRLDEDVIPDTWSLWFDRQSAEAHTGVRVFPSFSVSSSHNSTRPTTVSSGSTFFRIERATASSNKSMSSSCRCPCPYTVRILVPSRLLQLPPLRSNALVLVCSFLAPLVLNSDSLLYSFYFGDPSYCSPWQEDSSGPS